MKRILHFLSDNYLFTGALFGAGVALIFLFSGQEGFTVAIAVFIVLVVIAFTAFDMARDIIRGHYGLDILALVAMVATLLVGEYAASLIIVLMLTGGEALEDYAQKRAAKELTALLDRSPKVAHLIQVSINQSDQENFPESSMESFEDIPVQEVSPGDFLLVRPYEIVPIDGELISEYADFDESSITGESLPVTKYHGDEVLSGVVNGASAIRIRAIRTSENSQYQQITSLVKQAQESKAPTVRIADRFAVPFTLVSLMIAAIAWYLSGDPLRFAQVLVLATPCPLLIAAPVAFLGGLSRAAKAGAIVKGGAVMEQLARVKSAAFDKTGTLTVGRPNLLEIIPTSGFSKEELLQLAASAEQYSSHVLASGILAAAKAKQLHLLTAEYAEETATNGVIAKFDSRRVVLGKYSFVVANVSKDTLANSKDLNLSKPHSGELAVYVAVDGKYAGALIMSDPVRVEASNMINWLHSQKIAPIIMLTGDSLHVAQVVAKELGIDTVHAELIPQEKVQLATELTPRPMLMVGDGLNDAPVLAAADVGIAMGARGATASAEAADVVILRDDISVVRDAIEISKSTLSTAYTAIWMGIILSIGLMLVATTGIIPAIGGAMLQEVVDLVAILYALRALGGKRKKSSAQSAKIAKLV
ncbi:MAG: heavy metal translocating P-type ATPase [Microbacteriaceae bacterium]|nr:heavy metal translocating P-type ATPase [Microbacteriaceae bacterium]